MITWRSTIVCCLLLSGCQAPPPGGTLDLPVINGQLADHHGAALIGLPDSGGILLNGHATTREQLVSQLPAMYQGRGSTQQAVFVQLGPKRDRADAASVVDAMRRLGLQVFDGIKSGYVVPEVIVQPDTAA